MMRQKDEKNSFQTMGKTSFFKRIGTVGGFAYTRYKSQTILVDFRHRLTVMNMNDTPIPIGQLH